MTIGERIFQIRKEKGLSQEELAKQLLVSRQTISQWETDQTVPSIDNMYRLKDVLQVSIGELFDEPAEKSVAQERPVEEFRFFHTKEDARALNKLVYRKPFAYALGLYVIGTLIFGYILLKNGAGFGAGMAAGVLFVVLVAGVRSILTTRKAVKEFAERAGQREFVYRVFDDRFTVTILEKGDVSSHYAVRRDGITAFWEDAQHYVWQRANQLFVVRKSCLAPNTRFPLFLPRPAPVPTSLQKPKKSPLSTLLIVLSILSLFMAMYGVLLAMGINGGTLQNLAVFFVFTPLPIASIVFGIRQNRKGVRNRKNIVVGAIMLAILCIYGSFSFVFSDMYTYDFQAMTQWEQETGLDFPDSGEIVTQDFTVSTQNGAAYLYAKSTVTFDEQEAAAFAGQIAADTRWMARFPSRLHGCLPYVPEGEWEYCLLYNLDTKTFNALPPESGSYHFAFFRYTADTHTLTIEDYKMEIVVD